MARKNIDFSVDIPELDDQMPGYMDLETIRDGVGDALATLEVEVIEGLGDPQAYWALVAAAHIVAESGMVGFRFKADATRDDVDQPRARRVRPDSEN